MRTLTFLSVISAAAGVEYRTSYGGNSRNYGTTGHYNNMYGHGGNDDHNHDDHKYGYDSVPNDKYLLSGDRLIR